MTESLSYLRTPAAIRERASRVLKYVEDGRSEWFALDANGLEAAVQATLAVTRERFPDPAKIPFHSRWRHFEAGGRDRWTALADRLAGLPPEEIARRRIDLAVVSVLLDAGRRDHRAWVAAALATPIAEAPPAAREALTDRLVLVTDVYAWKLLRRDVGRSRTATEAAIAAIIAAILAARSNDHG